MKKTLFLILICLNFSALAQIPIGTWKDHFSFEEIIASYELKDGTIVSASESGLFYKNTDGSIEKLTKVNGLSDIGVSAMKYIEEADAIILGYEDGNIDIIFDKKVKNISDLKRKQIAGKKTITSILFYDNFVYLSCGLGILKIDIKTPEIIETYFIEGNKTVSVFKTMVKDDTLYAATNWGLYYANINSDLFTYDGWNIDSTYNYYTDIETFNNKIYAVVRAGETYKLISRNSSIYKTIIPEINAEAKLFLLDKLYLINDIKIQIIDTTDMIENSIEHYPFTWTIRPTFIGKTKDDFYLIGDKLFGTVVKKGSYCENFYPSGVFKNEVAKLSAIGQRVIATRGGHGATTAPLWYIGHLSIYKSGVWENIEVPKTNDFYSILQDDSDVDHFYVGSWGTGMYEFQGTELLKRYNNDNSPLLGYYGGNSYIRISGMAYDKDKNIWTANLAHEEPIHILKNDGTWETYKVKNMANNMDTYDVLVSSSDIFWVSLGPDGFLAVDYNNTIENENDDIVKVFYPLDEANEKIGKTILSMTEDKNGDIWFGTDEGVGVFYSQSNFNNSNFRANRIKITAKLNDSLVTGHLLAEELVYSIAVDGGNRKWIGTGNSGVYLMSKNGTKELLHFTTENSPLPSNRVNTIAIEPETGEVFFGTKKGVVSYRSDATTANASFANVYAYPNPVRPEYSGTISIVGLMYETNVKITDIAGNIVFETKSNGGQASWDGTDFAGRRVHTGVYLVFCANKDGSESCVTKILFIN